MTQPGTPPEKGIDDYLAGPETLGFEFQYPPEYLECIAWGDRDLDAGGDGHALWFLSKESISRDLTTFVRKASLRRLVPFARGGNGEALYCFDGRDSRKIYAINLGEKPPKVRRVPSTNFVEFINLYRADLDLPKWDWNQGE